MLDRRPLPAAEVVRVFRHPDGVTVGLSLLAEDGASIGWAAGDHRDRTLDTGRHLLVGAVPMRLVGEVTYPGPSLVAPDHLHPSGRGTWLTSDGPTMRAWTLPPVPGEQLRLPLG